MDNNGEHFCRYLGKVCRRASRNDIMVFLGIGMNLFASKAFFGPFKVFLGCRDKNVWAARFFFTIYGISEMLPSFGNSESYL